MGKTIATKFVNHEIPALEELKESRVYRLREKLNRGEEMTREEKDWLAKNIRESILFSKAVPLMGWRFDFSDVLKTYVVKQYGPWTEYHAPDRTSLYRMLYGRIERILEVA